MEELRKIAISTEAKATEEARWNKFDEKFFEIAIYSLAEETRILAEETRQKAAAAADRAIEARRLEFYVVLFKISL